LLTFVSRYGLLAVVAGTFFEGEGVLTAASVLARQGLLNVVAVWMAAAGGAWTGHLCWFLVGRKLGRNRTGFRSKRLQEGVSTAERLLMAHPRAAVFILQYLYGMRMIGALALGSTALSLGKFAVYQALNCLIWAALVTGVGFVLGGVVMDTFHGWLKWVWMAASILFLLLVFRSLERLLANQARELP